MQLSERVTVPRPRPRPRLEGSKTKTPRFKTKSCKNDFSRPRLESRELPSLHLIINHSWEFHQIYNFDAVGEKMNWWDFEIKRLKVRVTGRPHIIYHLGRHFLAGLQTHWHTLMKLTTVTHYHVHMTLIPFSRSWVHRHFPKMHFSGGVMSMDSLTSKTI